MTLTYERNDRYRREVYCPQCHIYSWRSDREPKCDNCNTTLIRVVYDAMTGERITGRIQREEKNDNSSN